MPDDIKFHSVEVIVSTYLLTITSTEWNLIIYF